MDEDFLAGMVQETMYLDVSDLCRQPKSRKRRQGFTGKPVESVMCEVSKESVLEFVGELESGQAVALKVSHVEDVSTWVKAIRELLECKEDAVLFGDLVSGLGLAPVAVLIGVLFGGLSGWNNEEGSMEGRFSYVQANKYFRSFQIDCTKV